MQAKAQKSTLMRKEEALERKNWYLVSARDKVLGRLAANIAMVLMGKHQPSYTPHVDTGDFVIVTDAEKVRVSGKKALIKSYDYYTYHTGGHKYVSFNDMMARKPEKVISEAVRRMLPKNKLGRAMLSKLKVYRGSDHPHQAQMPRPWEFKF